MTTPSDLLRVLGGVLLDGARAELHETLAASGLLASLATAATGTAGLATAHAAASPVALAADYTRLTIANAVDGKRRPVPAPPYADCYPPGPREVMGDRHRAAVLAYATAGLGFDGMEASPADHVGLELTFVAQLLAEEEAGTRGPDQRLAFVRDQVVPLVAAFGAALASSAKEAFWVQLGETLPRLVVALAGDGDHAAPRPFPVTRAAPSPLPVVS